MMNKFVRHIGFQVRETGHSENFIQLGIGLWDIAQYREGQRTYIDGSVENSRIVSYCLSKINMSSTMLEYVTLLSFSIKLEQQY